MKRFFDSVERASQNRELISRVRRRMPGAIESAVDAFEFAQVEVGDRFSDAPNFKFDFLDGSGDGEPFLKVWNQYAEARLWFDKPWNAIAVEIERMAAFPMSITRFLISAKINATGQSELALIGLHNPAQSADEIATVIIEMITVASLEVSDLLQVGGQVARV